MVQINQDIDEKSMTTIVMMTRTMVLVLGIKMTRIMS